MKLLRMTMFRSTPPEAGAEVAAPIDAVAVVVAGDSGVPRHEPDLVSFDEHVDERQRPGGRGVQEDGADVGAAGRGPRHRIQDERVVLDVRAAQPVRAGVRGVLQRPQLDAVANVDEAVADPVDTFAGGQADAGKVAALEVVAHRVADDMLGAAVGFDRGAGAVVPGVGA
jgi:hypothetical protein